MLKGDEERVKMGGESGRGAGGARRAGVVMSVLRWRRFFMGEGIKADGGHAVYIVLQFVTAAPSRLRIKFS